MTSVPFTCEFYADLDYDDHGRQVITKEHAPVAPEAAAAKVLRAVRDGLTRSLGGKDVKVVAESICVHSDTPGALEVTFEGEIHGDQFSMTDYGSKVTQSGNCTYTVNAVIAGTVSGNSIEGTVTYTPAITDNPDCEALKCQAEQAYSGSRPPPG